MVLDRPGSGVTANTRVIAVNVPNQQGINYDWKAYRVSVKTLEGLTGYHFLDGVPAATRSGGGYAALVGGGVIAHLEL